VVYSGISVVAVTDAGEMTQRTPPRHGEHTGVTDVRTGWEPVKARVRLFGPLLAGWVLGPCRAVTATV